MRRASASGTAAAETGSAAATTAAKLESLYEIGRAWFTQASEIEKKILDTTWKGAAFGAGWLSLIQLLLA